MFSSLYSSRSPWFCGSDFSASLRDAKRAMAASALAVIFFRRSPRRRTISSALSASSSTASAAPTSAFCVAHIWKKKLSIVPSAPLAADSPPPAATPLAAGSPPPTATTPLGSDMLFASSTPALPLIALQARFGQP